MTSATAQAAPVGSPGSRRPAPPGLPRRRHRSRARRCRGRGHRARPPGPRAGFRDLPDGQTRGDAARRGRRDRLRPVTARQRRPDAQFLRRHAKPSDLPDIVAWIAALRPCTDTPRRGTARPPHQPRYRRGVRRSAHCRGVHRGAGAAGGYSVVAVGGRQRHRCSRPFADVRKVRFQAAQAEPVAFCDEADAGRRRQYSKMKDLEVFAIVKLSRSRAG